MFKPKSIRDLPESWDFIRPEAGSQIRVKRPLYYHHGIFTGNSVIHFGEGDASMDMQNSSSNIVKECTMDEFLQGGMPEVRVYSRKEKKLLLPAEEIVKRAKSCIGNGEYHFYRNNCEHFSNYCAFNESYSRQAESLTKDVRKMIGKEN